MPPVRLVLGILLATLTALPTSAEELSLRERIERARAAARERAQREATPATPAPSSDPTEDPELWEIFQFGVVCPGRVTRCIVGPTDWVQVPEKENHYYSPARFFAKIPQEQVGEDIAEGVKVFFYYMDEGGELRLGGRGEIKAIRRGRQPVAQAVVETCRFTSQGKVRSWNGRAYDTEEFMRLLPEKSPKKISWFMSNQLKGPDVAGWDVETIRRFALGQPWMGMPRSVLEAMLGEPVDRLEIAGAVSLVYGTGPDAMRYDITNGVVTGRTPVNQF